VGGAAGRSYVEYDRRGRVVGGLQKALPKSKYDEDVFEEGHTQVWGSWSKLDPATGEVVWGYGCCQSTVRGCRAPAPFPLLSLPFLTGLSLCNVCRRSRD
jgi:hypothetical protein